jgi:hypothetical protein
MTDNIRSGLPNHLDLPQLADVPPWEQPGFFRLDCEPHRAWLLRTLAILAAVGGPASLIGGGILSVYLDEAPRVFMIGLLLLPTALGTTVVLLARKDLAAMRRGQIDPEGETLTRKAEDLGAAAMLVYALTLVFVLSSYVWLD